MTNSKELFQELLTKITLPDRDEAQAILFYLLESKFGIDRSAVMMGKLVTVAPEKFEDDLIRINQHEPIQYITGEAWFRNRKFLVNTSVLIPRPETELLVQKVIDEKPEQPSILDVGTGSGCIAISLALDIPNSKTIAIDISEQAIAVAKENANRLGAKVEFIQSDFLHDEIQLRSLDFIVSNPPYVRESEKKEMGQNVLSYEPHLALFVSNDDPLIFYKALANRGKRLLKQGGKLFAEINSNLGTDTKLLFERSGFKSVQLIRDLEEKYRIVVATL